MPGKIMGIDVGITTGLAVFQPPSTIVHSIGLKVQQDGPEGVLRSMRLAVERHEVMHLVIELPIFSPQSPMYNQLLDIATAVQGEAAALVRLGHCQMKMVRPVTWKSTPAKHWWAEHMPEHRMCIHERDAMRIAYWYYQFGMEAVVKAEYGA